jgi:hypothetical protein
MLLTGVHCGGEKGWSKLGIGSLRLVKRVGSAMLMALLLQAARFRGAGETGASGVQDGRAPRHETTFAENRNGSGGPRLCDSSGESFEVPAAGTDASQHSKGPACLALLPVSG